MIDKIRFWEYTSKVVKIYYLFLILFAKKIQHLYLEYYAGQARLSNIDLLTSDLIL